jgi:diguanylate cyclase (GGDEF)-like protein
MRASQAGSTDTPLTARAPFDPRAILTSIGESVYDWDLSSDALSWGLNATEVFGLADIGQLSTGRAFALAVEPDSGITRLDAILASQDVDTGTGVPYRTRYALRLKGDRPVFVEDTGRWYADASGRAAFAHGVVRIERQPAGGALAENERGRFLAEIKAEVAEAARSNRPLTLFVASLAAFGPLSDGLGYEVADEMLDEVARRVRTVMRRRDRLARYAGNRFALLLMACSTEQAEIAAGRLLQAVEASPVGSAAGLFGPKLRIGAATAPNHALDATSLLRRAESALGEAIRSLAAPFALFDPAASREDGPRGRGTPALDVVEALNARRITFARQPVVEAASRDLAFSEALVRIRGPGGAVVRATDILPSVERAGLVPLLDSRMLELAADDLAAHPEERLSINVSPLTLSRPDWLGLLAAHLGARPGIAERVIIEITETAIIADPQAMRARLDAMKALGVAIAINDFGAGHTSFKHLRNFPVDVLKMDGAFIQNLSRSPDDRFFVRTLIDLAHHLGITTVAEWVEDEETAQLLAGWGVDYLQGDHCGVPVLAVERAGQEGLAALA